LNESDITRIAKTAYATCDDLARHGVKLLRDTSDWQSPLRSGGGGPSCKGEYSDPTPSAVLAPDPLALEKPRLVAAIAGFAEAADELSAIVHRLKAVDPSKVERGRINDVPACIVCSGPAVPCRRGLCGACYKAWKRADEPDITQFRNARLAAAVPSVVHVDPTSTQGVLDTRTTMV
jgi:hypothetical protein